VVVVSLKKKVVTAEEEAGDTDKDKRTRSFKHQKNIK